MRLSNRRSLIALILRDREAIVSKDEGVLPGGPSFGEHALVVRRAALRACSP